MFALVIANILVGLGIRRLNQEPEAVVPRLSKSGGGAPFLPSCLDPSLFSAQQQLPAPVFDAFNSYGQDVLKGTRFYFTPKGQEQVLAALSAFILGIPNEFVIEVPDAVAMTRQTAVRVALDAVFPECSWWIPLQDYSAEQYQAWLSAGVISAALEADAGKSLKAEPRSGSAFIHREDLGLLGAVIGGVPVGTIIALNASDPSGDNAEIVMAEVIGTVDPSFTQDVKIRGPVHLASQHGVGVDSVHKVSTPWNTMAILQEAMQPNPRTQNPMAFAKLFYPAMGL